jgi:hypothetical protein
VATVRGEDPRLKDPRLNSKGPRLNEDPHLTDPRLNSRTRAPTGNLAGQSPQD